MDHHKIFEYLSNFVFVMLFCLHLGHFLTTDIWKDYQISQLGSPADYQKLWSYFYPCISSCNSCGHIRHVLGNLCLIVFHTFWMCVTCQVALDAITRYIAHVDLPFDEVVPCLRYTLNDFVECIVRWGQPYRQCLQFFHNCSAQTSFQFRFYFFERFDL